MHAARLAGIALAALAAMLVAMFVGAADVPAGSVVSALLHPRGPHDDANAIVWGLRLPRVCIAAAVGFELAAAGVLLQGLLRNPLVDPYLTGVSAGAGLVISIAVALGAFAGVLPALGAAAGIGTAALVAMLARRGARIDVQRLILAGVSISALFSAVIALVLTTLGRGSSTEAILGWLAGSLAGRGWSEFAWSLPYALAGALVAVVVSPALNVLRIGEQRAAAVGVDVTRVGWFALAAGALLTASAVSLSGIVGFVGLIVPHLARRIVGSDIRLALPASALLGVALVEIADAVSRTIVRPAEIPLGVLLAFVGVPVFLSIYLRRSGSASWTG